MDEKATRQTDERLEQVKTINAKSKIGAGLFTDDTLEIKVEFEDGGALMLEVYPITQDMIVDLERDGVKFGEYANNTEAMENGSQIFNRIAKSAKYIGPGGNSRDLDGKYKDRIMQLPDVMAGIFEAASEHGATIYREDEKNSAS